ncbi:MAG: transcriptional regulator MntR [Planctomycetota bacterium]|nr:MAG: transcriptional regulator MntR [Planctomycetota bacterium]
MNEAGNTPSNRKPTTRRRTKDARRSAAVEQQARRHGRIREDHSAETAEDYVELIAQLIAEHGEARTVDLAARLGVSHVTVTRTIARLQRDGFVNSEPYRSIFLTDRGRELAERAKERHRLVVAFLRRLGVSQAAAETDAEGIEHHISEETIAAFRRFVERGA